MRFLTVIFILCACAFYVAGQDAGSAPAARPYRELSTFSGDTVQYHVVNFSENKQRYVGHPLEEFLQDYELEIRDLEIYPLPEDEDYNAGKRITRIRIFPLTSDEEEERLRKGGTVVCVDIIFKEPLILSERPDAKEIVGMVVHIEPNKWLVAMKMKEAVVGDINALPFSWNEED